MRDDVVGPSHWPGDPAGPRRQTGLTDRPAGCLAHSESQAGWQSDGGWDPNLNLPGPRTLIWPDRPEQNDLTRRLVSAT